MQPNNQQNPYIFGDAEADRLRLETQTRLFVAYLQTNAKRLVGDNVRSILDLGCGEGQLALVLHEIYPDARIVGIDKDEKALAKAKQAAQQASAANMEFVAGDIQQRLPDGPFDLVYCSMVLQHIPDLDAVMNGVYQRLQPGGCFWVKQADNKTMTSYDNESYKKMFKLFYAAVTKLGAHPDLPDYIDDELHKHDFTDVVTEFEEYPLGGSTPEGWAMMGITLGLFHNTQGLMAKMTSTSEQEIMRMYIDVVNEATLNRNKEAVQTFRDTIARKP